MSRRAKAGIGKSAAALLAELARHAPMRMGAAPPRSEAAAHAASALVAADLARQLPGGGLEITDAGRAHLARAGSRAVTPMWTHLLRSISRSRKARPRQRAAARALPSIWRKARSPGSRAARDATAAR
jgi:hypothetical protein